MERVEGSDLLPAGLRGGIVALGNFDGFHVGHQAVVGRALSRARAEGCPALVLTFDPHPARLFHPDARPFLLTTIPQRFDLFEAFGMDGALAIPFSRAIAALTPEEFVRTWLVERLAPAGLVTGEDFTFGKDRAGNVALLAELARPHGIAVEVVAPVAAGGEIASSSRIRAHLRTGEMAPAARLLSRPYTIAGIVDHGDKRGRTIGYPTANVTIGDYLRPAYGIYAVRVRLPDGRVLDGAANLGIRPSFDPPKELLEATLFDFSGDLYGQEIAVELIERIRPEAKFDSLDDLVAQMDRDCAAARAILAANPALA